MQTPSEEVQEQEENIKPKHTYMKEEVQKEEERVQVIKEVKEGRRQEEEEEEKGVDVQGGDYLRRSPSPVSYYSTLSSFDSENEKRIQVDPISFSDQRDIFEEDGPLSMPSVFTEVTMHSPILPAVRTPRFVSASLPCSASSSPHYYFSGHQKSNEPYFQPNSGQSPRTLARQHSIALTRFASTRSKSFAEERTLTQNDTFHLFGVTRRSSSGGSPGSSSSTSSESPKPKPKMKGSKEEDFKCTALCMYLPSFSKKKQMQLRHQVSRGSGDMSRLASLEKFNCGSWSPRKAGNAFDTDHMPVEMERSSTGDTESPIRTAFLFDGVERRGILKKSSSRFGSTKSMGSTSNVHVRFSVANSPAASCPSSPSVSSVCMSPRLMKARQEFSSFLEAAQSS